MEIILHYRGKQVTDDDVASICALIDDNPEASRRALSRQLCEMWQWKQPNGELRDAVCRGLMLKLHRAGHIELPSPRWRGKGAGDRHSRSPDRVVVDTTALRCSLRDLGELSIRQVRRTAQEPLFDGLLEAHHYLGSMRPVGEHLKFLVSAGDRPVACFVWSSAPRHLGPRDRYIGWPADVRRRSIRLVAANNRFLILPWVEVRHLASHLLGRMTRMLPAAWEEVYEHPVWFAETFIDPTRFAGTCYRAANWVDLGQTTGRGKDDQTHLPNRTKKDVLGLPLHRRFRQLLQAEA